MSTWTDGDDEPIKLHRLDGSKSYADSYFGEERSTPERTQELHYVNGDITENYDFGDKIAGTENGGQGTIYRAKRKSDGLDVVVKVYATSENAKDWDEILHEEKRAGREIRFLERANARNVMGLPVLLQYG